MRKLIGTIALVLASLPGVHAQDSIGDKAHEVKEGAVKTSETVADGAREVGHEIKKTAQKARRAVITRCADGRHTIKGESGCRGHGGVSLSN
jgi:hypothetical protein